MAAETGVSTSAEIQQEPADHHTEQVNLHRENESEYSSDSDSEDDYEKPKPNSRKPGDNAFRQQRLKAYNPVFTARTVIPLLMAIAVVFVPLGAAMWYASDKIEDFAIDYSHCERLANTHSWSPVPDKYLDYHLKDEYKRPQWKLSTDESQDFDDEKKVCEIQFNVPKKLKAPIYLFYRLEKFHANHRRFVKSYSEEQIIGHAATKDQVKNTVGENCSPMALDDNGKIIYPCGLIANSLFNDTYSSTIKGVNGTSHDYKMTNKGIAWSSDKERFKKTKYKASEVVPPPNWYKKYPNGYTEDNLPDVSQWEEFQNWMHPAGLPTFNRLVLRNDDDALEAGTYQISVGLHFPVLPFNGGKYVYFSQRSVMGGKNPFIGIAWMAGGGVCFVLSIFLLVVNTLKPRKTGDVNLLSWNKEVVAKDQATQ